MGIIGSLFGAAIGWWTLGPIGALLGLFLGNVTEESSKNNSDRQRGSVVHDGFMAALLVLMGAIVKADGKVLRSELDYIKSYLVNTIGQDKTQEALIILRDLIKRDISIAKVCFQINEHLNYSDKLQLMHLLIGLANADGYLHNAELLLLNDIANRLDVTKVDLNSLLGVRKGDDIQAAYEILEVDSKATNDEVKKAYRKMALKYHPDKVLHLGDEFQKSAKEKFQKVGGAYERIKNSRKMA